jgi:hypothetical protein
VKYLLPHPLFTAEHELLEEVVLDPGQAQFVFHREPFTQDTVNSNLGADLAKGFFVWSCPVILIGLTTAYVSRQEIPIHVPSSRGETVLFESH